MELKHHYNDDNFHYSCPCCRENTKTRKRTVKELRKSKPSSRPEAKQTYKRR
jgi:hypothetical protein